jgi:hypothetical protein
LNAESLIDDLRWPDPMDLTGQVWLLMRLPGKSFLIPLMDSFYAQSSSRLVVTNGFTQRLDFRIQLSEQLLRHGKIAMAREQLRHMLDGWARQSSSRRLRLSR